MQGDDANEMRRNRLLSKAVQEQTDKLFRIMSKHQIIWGTVVMKSLPGGRYEFYNADGRLVDVYTAWNDAALAGGE